MWGVDTADVPLVNQGLVNEATLPNYHKLLKKLNKSFNAESRTMQNALMEIVNEAVEDAKEHGRDLSIADLEGIRTAYHRQLDLFAKEGTIQPVGSGSSADLIYNALTEDLYHNIDAAVTANPNLPTDLGAKIKASKTMWRDIKAREKTPAAEFLRSHQATKAAPAKPAALIDNILAGKIRGNDLDEMFEIIGAMGSEEIRLAVLHQIFEKSKRQGEWSPKGLANQLGSDVNRNKLRDIFGDDEVVKELSELAAFSERFSRLNRMTTGSPTGYINELVSGQNPQVVSGILNKIALIKGIIASGGSNWFENFQLAANFLDSAVVARFLAGEGGRKWLLEGYDKAEKMQAAANFIRQHKTKVGMPAQLTQQAEDTRTRLGMQQKLGSYR